MLILLFSLLFSLQSYSATIAIIDTGFDLDHDFLKPKIMKNETDEERVKVKGWNPHDNSHLKKAVVEDQGLVQEILLYRNLKAKGHKEGLSVAEFEWFKKKGSDKKFMETVRLFKKHSHGTFVAGIALREGENINIFPIRGLNLPHPVVAVEDSSQPGAVPLKGKSGEEKFQAEIQNSLNRVSKKFNKICRYISQRNIQIVNASYGITHKNIRTRFQEKYKELTGVEIADTKLQLVVNDYFVELYRRGEKTIKSYPKILFIFSAGNSGLDNDNFHHYPSRIKLPNTLAVAAMNGDYLASFSNYGYNVDIGAPGVAILSLVPKVYSGNGDDIYSPSSGTSMAAPHISNLAAQILNTNEKLTPEMIKKIILGTGDEKMHLKPRLSSGGMVNNDQAIKAALLSKDMDVLQAINLARSKLIQMEDQISIGLAPAVTPENLKQKVLNSVPTYIPPEDIDDEAEFAEETPTRSQSLPPKDQAKGPRDNSRPPALTVPVAPVEASDPTPASQTSGQSPPLSVEPPASSSPPEPKLPEDQPPLPSPSSPQ